MMRIFLTAMLLLTAMLGCSAPDRGANAEPVGSAPQEWNASWANVGSALLSHSNAAPAAYADSSGAIVLMTSNVRTYWMRTSTDGQTVVTPWTVVPGQGLTGVQWTPAITRGNTVLRTRVPYFVFHSLQTGAVEYTVLNHYLVGNTWSWTGTWTTMPSVTVSSSGVAAAYLSSIGRIYVFWVRPSDGQILTKYTSDNGANWAGPYFVGGTGAYHVAAVPHWLTSTTQTIELVRHNNPGAHVQWNRMLNAAALDSSYWNGWTEIPGHPSPGGYPSALAQKENQWCEYEESASDGDVYENCTTDGTNFSATYTLLSSDGNTLTGTGAASYCTDNVSPPDKCSAGSTRKFVYRHDQDTASQLQLQAEDHP